MGTSITHAKKLLHIQSKLLTSGSHQRRRTPCELDGDVADLEGELDGEKEDIVCDLDGEEADPTGILDGDEAELGGYLTAGKADLADLGGY